MTATRYGQDELAKLLPRRRGELYELLARYVPIAFPHSTAGVIELAMIGFTSTTEGWTEATGRSRHPAPFDEIGIFNVPAGDRLGIVPNPNPAAPNNAWGHYAHSGLVVRLLGRPAVMGPTEWPTAHADQVAVGLADQLGYDALIRGALPAALRPSTSAWTPYRVGLMFGGFTIGGVGVAHALAGYAAGAPAEASRLPWLRSQIVARGDMRAARVIFSADAKLESARVVAQRVGEAPDQAFLDWWEPARPTGGAEDVALARLAAHHAAGTASTAGTLATRGGGSAGASVGGAGMVGVLAAAALALALGH